MRLRKAQPHKKQKQQRCVMKDEEGGSLMICGLEEAQTRRQGGPV